MALLKALKLTADPWTVVDGTGDPSGVDHPLITLESWVLHSDKLGSVNTPLGIFLKICTVFFRKYFLNKVR